jgi:hypothetical protein
MPIVKEEHEGSGGFIESRTGDGDRVRIYVEAEQSRIPAEGQISHVSVRVATFGDHPLSNSILDQVNVHLAPVTALPAAAARPAVPSGAVVPAGATTAPPPLAAPQQTDPSAALPTQPVPVAK